MPEKHKHEFTKYAIKNVIADNPRYEGAPKAFVLQVCTCGHTIPLFYGERKAMTVTVKLIELEERYKEKREGIPTSNTPPTGVERK